MSDAVKHLNIIFFSCPELSAVLLYLVAQLVDRAADVFIFFAQLLNALFGGKDRCMVYAERGSDLVGGFHGQFAAQIHRDQSRNHNIVGAAAAEDIGDAYSEILGHLMLDALNGRLFAFLRDLGSEQFLGSLNGEFGTS